MAIQSINLGALPDGKGGDTVRSTAVKINENFSNASHAASRQVGTAVGDLVELKTYGVLGSGSPTPMGHGWGGVQGQSIHTTSKPLLNELFRGGSKIFRNSIATDISTEYSTGIFCQAVDSFFTLSVSYLGNSIKVASGLTPEGSPLNTQEIYTNKNVTKDSNGFLKAASPVVDLYNDTINLNDDALKQNITFEKLGVGDYLVKGSLGFSQDGWYIETPKDANGNVLVAVVYEQLANNDLSIKTYSKKFDEDTGNIVANLLRARDIPVGRFISLRLHELPVEELPVETIKEV